MITNKSLTNNLKLVLAVALILFVSCGKQLSNVSSANSWEKMEQILKSMPQTSFLNKEYDISDFGAIADGKTLNTKVFQQAIETCAQNGGGRVVVPEGKYLTGAIHLESNVNLYLEDHAEILFSTNPDDYPMVRTSFEGTELMNYSPFIYANNKTNVAITGKGTLNGQSSAKNWWSWCGKEEYGWKKGMPSQADPLNRLRLVDMAENGLPVEERIFGEGHYLRPNFLEFFECSNVLIKEVKIKDVPFWIIHPMKSKNVIIDGVTITSHGPNNDGCDPEYSKNVLIKNCSFNTGDDCIAIKAGRDADGRRVAIKSENIIVQNCKMFDGHGGVTIGSEISAGVSTVFVENCQMSSPNLDIAIRVKTNSRRGGLIENFNVRNLEIGQVKEAVLKVDMFYAVHGNQTGDFIPRVQNIFMKNIKVKNGGKYGILARGYATSPIENVLLDDVVIEKTDSIYSLKNVKNIKFVNSYINGKQLKSIKN